MSDPCLADLQTPALIVDETKMQANLDRLQARAERLGVVLRPHLKTSKSLDIAARQLATKQAPATVSTMKEAEVFAEAGYTNLLYAVGISPDKLERVIALRKRGVDLVVLLDSEEQAEAVNQASESCGERLPALIEIDCDGHRGGVQPDSAELIQLGRLLAAKSELRGVLTHAGESYGVYGREAHLAFAVQERDAAVSAAKALRAAGLACPVVSVGSTPTAHAAEDLTGATELRAGVYVFFDLVMAGIGVCQIEDIALSVLTSVIGRQKAKGWVLVDAGWMALSRDRGTASQKVDQGYGLVMNEVGTLLPDLIVSQVNQEHGIITVRRGSNRGMPDFPVGTRLRILPNHACATAAQHDAYQVIPAEPETALKRWGRFGGW